MEQGGRQPEPPNPPPEAERSRPDSPEMRSLLPTPDGQQRVAQERYLALDAIRGVCAILVAFMHGRFLCGREILPSAYIVVDLFFIMSGFVIANAYEKKLLRGGYFKVYLLRRFARLLPMWLLGLAISFISIFPFAWHAGQTAGLIKSSLLNLFFLPNLAPGYLFPTNVPGWSLFFEMSANLVYGMIVRRLSVRMLCIIVLVSAGVVTGGALHNGTLDGGSKMETIYLGFARVGFGFFLGVLAYRMPRPIAFAGSSGTASFAIVMGALALAVSFHPSGRLTAMWDLLILFLGCPIVFWIGLKARPSWTRICEGLGALSYPLYAIHFAVLFFVFFLYHYLTHWRTTYLPITATVIVLLGTTVIALVLGYLVDPWAQRRAGRLLSQRPVHVPVP